MVLRAPLQEVLESICEHVYFQPPANVQMEYPAIVYERDRGDTQYAGNLPYRHTKEYQVTLITRDPDDPRYDLLAALPMSQHERFYVADNLNHDVFTIFF